VISETRREYLRRIHRPGPEGVCAIQQEAYPCDAIQLLDELEQVEAAARASFDQIRQEKARETEQLRADIEMLQSKIREAVRGLS